MMKRFVVLQDEQFILTELARLSQNDRLPVANAAAMAPPDVSVRSESVVPQPVSVPSLNGSDESSDDLDGAGGVDLQALVKVTSLKVEREAIEQALFRFRWNRRKAAAYLSVSYKTLLNKMKECGINDPEAV
jgi:DNA-binding NtrC family response regulator